MSGAADRPPPADPVRVGFVLEQMLGHVTHSDNLMRLVVADGRIDPEFVKIRRELDPRWARVPGHSNWTVRSGLRARRGVHGLQRSGPLDALFVHTQVPATLIPDLIRRVPSVVSLDATPHQYDQLGEFYGHRARSRPVERAKRRLHRACLDAAVRLVAWSEWTKESLVDDYGIAPEKIDVIAPGVDYERWAGQGCDREGLDGPVRILFVGGDFSRKGGDDLVQAVRRLRSRGLPVELDLVTAAPRPVEDGIRVHTGLGPNDPALIRLYREAQVFCLPTRGDCLPMVLSEAGALGLPLVSTDVGAVREVVRPGQTGLLVPPGDVDALAGALDRVVGDRELRSSLGDAARDLVRERFDAATNASRLVDVLVDVARR